MPSEHLRHGAAASKSKAATHGLEGHCDTAGGVTVLDRAGDNFFGEMVSAWSVGNCQTGPVSQKPKKTQIDDVC